MTRGHQMAFESERGIFSFLLLPAFHLVKYQGSRIDRSLMKQNRKTKKYANTSRLLKAALRSNRLHTSCRTARSVTQQRLIHVVCKGYGMSTKPKRSTTKDDTKKETRTSAGR